MENSKLPFITDNLLQLNAVLRNSSQEFSDKGIAGRGGGVPGCLWPPLWKTCCKPFFLTNNQQYSGGKN